MSIEKEIGYPLVGVAAIEAGPEIIKDAVGDWGVGAEEIADTELGGILENTVDFAQDVAPSVATLAVVWAGFKYMFKGLENDKSKKRTGFAS
ncbi:MAG: hypothetical protein U9N04_00145 [Patescibacteria group bacterium]|nr:hypothetical protein [Patescibacteria group bacterium]